MSELLPFMLFGAAFAVLVAILLWKARASKATRQAELTSLGFRPCDAETDVLVQRIQDLENNREYQYSIDTPMRAELRGQPVYYYIKSRRRQGSITAAEELLLPLKRPTTQGLVLFVKPTELQASTATRLIGAVATGNWDAQPDDLNKIEIPLDLQGTNLIGALGPHGASFYDLIDGRTVSLIQRMGDAGVMIVMCRDMSCSLSSPSARMPFTLDKLWPLLDRLVAG